MGFHILEHESQIVALAMNPTLMEKLTKTGAGIKTIRVFGENAKVMVMCNTDGKFDLVFADTFNRSASDVKVNGIWFELVLVVQCLDVRIRSVDLSIDLSLFLQIDYKRESSKLSCER